MFIAYIQSQKTSYQLNNLQSIDIKLKRNDIGSASFVLFSDSIEKDTIKIGNAIEITKITNNQEKTYFRGIIAGFKADLNSIEVHCFSDLYILKRRIFLENKKYDNIPIATILNDIKNNSSYYDSVGIYSIDSDVVGNFSANFSVGKTLFDALKDIAGDAYDFDYYQGKLFFKKNIGIDRSFGENYLLLEFNTKQANQNNILKATAELDINNLSNCIVGKKSHSIDNASKNEFGLMMESLSGDEDIDAELEERKNPLIEYTIEPKDLDFFSCNIGDIIAVRVDTNNEIFSFDGSLKITEKNFKSGDIDTVTFKMSTGKIRQKNIFETISNLKNDVKNLKNNGQ